MDDVGRARRGPSHNQRDELVLVRAEPYNAETPLEALRHAITPSSHHFVRSNFALPNHGGRLVIAGAVNSPTTLTLDDLLKSAPTTITVTLECAGNSRIGLQPLPEGEPWAGQAIGTARWTGVRLAELLERVQPSPEGIAVTFTGADGGTYKGKPGVRFVRALPLEFAGWREHDVLVAYAMNDQPLSPDHGGPFRLIVPRWYGMASVKWLTRVDVRTTPFEGPFQTASYLYHWPDRPATPVTTMRVKSLITHPQPGSTLSTGSHVIEGKAWSGSRGSVTMVEVSVDAGDWQPVDLEQTPDPYTWRSWSFTWNANTVGRHVLRARATDVDGRVQPDRGEWNRLGYGNNAIQVVLVDIVAD